MSTLLVVVVDFTAALELPEVAAVLSRELFGAVPFVEGNGLRDEVPALILQRDFLGASVVLHGYGGEDGYSLDMETRPSWIAKMDPGNSSKDTLDIDISAYVAQLIAALAGFEVLRRGLIHIS